MKLKRNHLIIAVSTLALVFVLVIQVNWILQSAKMKEELFNEKAILVLSKTAEVLASDKENFSRMEPGKNTFQVRYIDSLFNYYMKFYNIHMGYFFEVKSLASLKGNVDVISKGPFQQQGGCYTQCIKEGSGNEASGLELKLVFPEKDQFIIEEMGIPFISSVILILLVLLMFWRTSFSLLKEKNISEHTRDFLNNMTHEFKTPLTNIALAAKMITRETTIKQVDKIKHYSGIIIEENEKLKLQVEQVLSMSALEKGEIPVQKTEQDLHQLIYESLKCMSIQIEHKGGNLKLHLNAKHSVIMADKTHFINAICNLIDNALKYSKEISEIIVESSNNNQYLVFVVSDNGIGIDKKYHKEVFEKYFRVPTGDIHNVKGFGLGLAYIKRIIELHGGTIELESDSNLGARFIIKLPHV